MVVSDSSAKTTAAVRSIALFVLGAQRSGTSVITRVLSLCGGTLPPALIGADQANPSGFWEPRKAIDVNEAMLYRDGSSWADPMLSPRQEAPYGVGQSTGLPSEIDAFFTSMPSAPLLIIKEPRITLLSEIWFDAARRADHDVTAVLSVRHPQEVTASLATHGHTSPELAGALWLKYSLLAERHTRGLPRIFVDYGNLLENWRREMVRISSTLPVEMNTDNEDAIEEFLEPKLRRQRYSGPVTDLFGTDWMSTAYRVLSAAARDEALDHSALDRIFEAYRTSARDFRTVFKDFDERFNSPLFRVLFPPFISRRVRAVGTLATSLGISPHRLRHYGQLPAGITG